MGIILKPFEMSVTCLDRVLNFIFVLLLRNLLCLNFLLQSRDINDSSPRALLNSILSLPVLCFYKLKIGAFFESRITYSTQRIRTLINSICETSSPLDISLYFMFDERKLIKSF